MTPSKIIERLQSERDGSGDDWEVDVAAVSLIRSQEAKLKIAIEALERFDCAYVIEPYGTIVGLERWHLEGAKKALARIKGEG